MIKTFFKDRINLLKASIIYTFQNETAYWANNIASAFSTTFYNIAYIIFINVLFSNTQNIAGYSYNEVLFFYFLTELGAYLNGLINLPNMDALIKDVNTGDLDLVLTKPVPSLFYVSFRKINILAFVRDSFPPLIILICLINWSAFSFSLINITAAVIIFIAGFVCMQSVLFISSLPVFWLGESSSILGLMHEFWFAAGTTVPFEGMRKVFGNLTIVFLPALLTTAVSTSILLNRSDPGILILGALCITVILVFLRSFLWKKALLNYSSASS